MKDFKVLIISFSCLLFSSNLLAQVTTAVPMLYLDPSPQLNGMGMVGTGLPTNDPFGFYYNPAQIGYNSQANNISLQFYPSKVNWLGLNVVSYNNIAVNAGYNFKNLLNGLSFSAGFGFIHSKMDYENPFGISPYYPGNDSYDEFNAYALGVGIDYYVQFNIGLTYKKITSVLSSAPWMSTIGKSYEATPSTFDYGLLLTVPVIKIIDPKYYLFKYKDLPAIPYFNFSIGYARLNQGGEAVYVDQAQADPLPRTARLGYSFSAGLDLTLKNTSLKIIDYNFTVDADDILIESNSRSYSYQSGIGDIQIGRNLIELKSSDKVVVHKGHNINIYETISFMIGRYDGRGYYSQKSSGWGLSAKGILKMIKANYENDIVDYIADHFDVQYYSTKLFQDSGIETNLKGIGLSFTGFFF
ncbi:MAG: hypothetical protein M1480_11625 [Bacteroidetes bacterium]|nr:hypothetical protein [Bacteroidota bacterium]